MTGSLGDGPRNLHFSPIHSQEILIISWTLHLVSELCSSQHLSSTRITGGVCKMTEPHPQNFCSSGLGTETTNLPFEQIPRCCTDLTCRTSALVPSLGVQLANEQKNLYSWAVIEVEKPIQPMNFLTDLQNYLDYYNNSSCSC